MLTFVYNDHWQMMAPPRCRCPGRTSSVRCPASSQRLCSVFLLQVYVIDTVDFTGEQQLWLENKLIKSMAPYTVVVGHYPIVSGGAAGNVMNSTVLPELLQRYDVSLYLFGHDALLQHLKLGNLNMIGSGARGLPRLAVCRTLAHAIMLPHWQAPQA